MLVAVCRFFLHYTLASLRLKYRLYAKSAAWAGDRKKFLIYEDRELQSDCEPTDKQSACTLTNSLQFFKFSRLYMQFNGFSDESNIWQGHKLVAKKLFCKNICLLLAFEFLWCDF